MKISDLDKNFSVDFGIDIDGLHWFDTKASPIKVYGMCSIEKGDIFRRIPKEVAESISEGVVGTGKCSAGGRIRFRTNSKHIALKADLPKWGRMYHMTFLGQSGFDIYSSDNGEYKFVKVFRPRETNGDYEAVVDTDGKWHTYTINMPLYNPVNEVYIGLDVESEIEGPEPYRYDKPVLYYGSSITQGGCASRPGNSYQAMISRKLDCDHINLGFSGNAKGELAMAEYIATLDVAAFVIDYDHNAKDAESLLKTHYPFYEFYRSKRPDTPIIFVSRPDYYPDKQDDVKRRDAVIATYERAIANGDKNVSFVDGAHLFDGEFADSCTVDGVHPNDLGFYRMALGIGAAVEKWLCK